MVKRQGVARGTGGGSSVAYRDPVNGGWVRHGPNTASFRASTGVLRPLSIGRMSEGTLPHHGDTRHLSMPPSSQSCCGVWLAANVLQDRLPVLAVNGHCLSAVSTLRTIRVQLPVGEMQVIVGVPRVTTGVLVCSQSSPLK